ncbi:hypothetical protein PPGU19_014980 [Paraburkholderia sp. PGU19]|nr:hypothetical protein [Paraburkholderia sp. PGU19]BCF96929.1 hypothetical protein PPGU19_014980 [Paraburkholderia sp. PGU19]
MNTIEHVVSMLTHTPLLATALLVMFALLGLETFMVRSGRRAAPDNEGDE